MSDAPQFQHFPQHMTHPQFRPATLDVWEDELGNRVNVLPTGKPGKLIATGKSIKFPPVTVNNQQQLEYHEAQGYAVSGKSNPHAFVAAMAIPDNAEATSYLEYPKMVGGVICEDEIEEEARKVEMAQEAVDAAQRERDEAARAAAAIAEPDALRGEVDALRQDVHETRQGLSRIEGMLELLLEQRTAPAPAADAPKGKGGGRAA